MSEPLESLEFDTPMDRLERMQDDVLNRLDALDQEILALLDRVSEPDEPEETGQREAA